MGSFRKGFKHKSRVVLWRVIGSSFQAWKITWMKSQRYLFANADQHYKSKTQHLNMKEDWGWWYRIGIWSGSKLKADKVYLGMSLRKMQWDSGQGKCVWMVEGSIFFSLTSYPNVSQINRYCWVLQITTPSRTQLLAQRADLISGLFALPFTGSWTSPHTGSEGKRHNREQ